MVHYCTGDIRHCRSHAPLFRSGPANSTGCTPRAREPAAPEDSAIVAIIRPFQRSTFEEITRILFEDGREWSDQISCVKNRDSCSALFKIFWSDPAGKFPIAITIAFEIFSSRSWGVSL